MKELIIKIKKFSLEANDKDRELLDEAVYAKLMDMMEEQSLSYSYTVAESESEDEEEEDM